MKTWNAIRTMLEKNSMPFINHLKGAKSLLWRGVDGHNTPSIKRVTQRQDRRPRFIDMDLHDRLDAWTKKNWGFPARSASTFTSASRQAITNYGDQYIIFPIGNFKYSWNNDVSDLYYSYDHFESIVHNEIRVNELKGIDEPLGDTIDKIFKTVFVPELKGYKTSNLNSHLKVDHSGFNRTECILHCKQYYIINNQWDGTLLGWYSDKYWKEK